MAEVAAPALPAAGHREDQAPEARRVLLASTTAAATMERAAATTEGIRAVTGANCTRCSMERVATMEADQRLEARGGSIYRFENFERFILTSESRVNLFRQRTSDPIWAAENF